MTAAILILLAGLFDRMRGSGWFSYSHFVGQVGMGVVIAFLLGVHGWIFAYVILAVIAGAAPGLGNPLGAAFDNRKMGTDYEWWQIGAMRKSILFALIVRGAIWGLPLAPISPFAVPAFAIAFTVTPYIARDITEQVDRWAVMEFSRGAIVALLIAASHV